MATIALVKDAITALKDRTGSSSVAISKYIETEKKVRRKLSSLEALHGEPSVVGTVVFAKISRKAQKGEAI